MKKDLQGTKQLLEDLMVMLQTTRSILDEMAEKIYEVSRSKEPNKYYQTRKGVVKCRKK